MAFAGIAVGRGFVTGVASGITSSAGLVTAAISTLTAAAQSQQLKMLGIGQSVGRAFGTGTASGISSQVGAVSAAAGSYVGVVQGYQLKMAGVGRSIGAALGQGVAAGIRGQIGAVAAAAAELVSAAMGAAKAAAAINSPSRLMRDEVGVNLALGVAEGIIAGVPAVMNASERLLPYVPVGTYAYSGTGATGYGGGNVHNEVNVYIDGSGDPEQVAELAGVRVMQALVHLNAEVTR
jgi:hypothetical protein